MLGRAVLGGGLLELVGGGRGGGVCDAEWLAGHRRPQEPDELAGDSDVRDGRALAVLGEVAVAMIEPDLRLPGALVRLGAGLRASRRMPVMPARLDRRGCPELCRS